MGIDLPVLRFCILHIAISRFLTHVPSTMCTNCHRSSRLYANCLYVLIGSAAECVNYLTDGWLFLPLNRPQHTLSQSFPGFPWVFVKSLNLELIRLFTINNFLFLSVSNASLYMRSKFPSRNRSCVSKQWKIICSIKEIYKYNNIILRKRI